MKNKHHSRAKGKTKRKRWARRYLWLSCVVSAVVFIFVGTFWVAFRDNEERQAYNPAKDSLAQTQPVQFGVTLGSMLSSSTHVERLKLLKHIKEMGFDEVRFNISWAVAQPKEGGAFDWRQADGIMRSVKESNMKSIIILNGAPSWAKADTCESPRVCPPEDMEAFAKFTAATVYRFHGDHVLAWEIWNEPNIAEFWQPQPDTGSYTDMLKRSYAAIKEKTPNAIVLFGGLAGNSVDTNGSGYIDPRTFLSHVYADGGKESFDGLSYHPYTGPRLPGYDSKYNGWYKMATGSNTIRGIMTANGDGKKGVWLTEFGLATGGKGHAAAPEELQSGSLKADHVTLESQAIITKAVIEDMKKYSWVKSFNWYTYKDDSLAQTYSGAAYGMLERDGTPKPVLKILQNAMYDAKQSK